MMNMREEIVLLKCFLKQFKYLINNELFQLIRKHKKKKQYN